MLTREPLIPFRRLIQRYGIYHPIEFFAHVQSEQNVKKLHSISRVLGVQLTPTQKLHTRP